MFELIQQSVIVGGSGGEQFDGDQFEEFSRDETTGIYKYFHAVEAVEAWYGKKAICGIQLTFTDALKMLFGKKEGICYGGIDLDYDNGEYIKSISLWSNLAGTKCGGFQLKTNTGKDYFPRITTCLAREHIVDVGAGILIGVFGRHNSDIDAL